MPVILQCVQWADCIAFLIDCMMELLSISIPLASAVTLKFLQLTRKQRKQLEQLRRQQEAEERGREINICMKVMCM